MPRQKKLRSLRANAAIKKEELLRQKLRLLYFMVMSLCDSIMEDKLYCHENFATVKCTRDMIVSYMSSSS